MDYAVIKTGGKQYRVSPGDVLQLEKLDGEPGAELQFTEVLMTALNGAVQVGTPTVAGARGQPPRWSSRAARKKILVFKKKRRKNYRRRQGHRQYQTTVRVTAHRHGSEQPWRIKKDRAARATAATAPASDAA